MQRLTTPTHTFTLPCDISTLDKVKIVYAQNNLVVLEKYKEDCEIHENILTCKLTQEDTCKFSEGEVQIQLRVKTVDGYVPEIRPYTRYVYDVLDDEVL